MIDHRNNVREKQHNAKFALLLVLAALAAGGVWLARDTVVQNVNYPDYSTLNDSPKGASLLYHALTGTALDVRRGYGRKDMLSADTTVFRIGVAGGAHIPYDSDEAMFLSQGGRIVCAHTGRVYTGKTEEKEKGANTNGISNIQQGISNDQVEIRFGKLTVDQGQRPCGSSVGQRPTLLPKGFQPVPQGEALCYSSQGFQPCYANAEACEDEEGKEKVENVATNAPPKSTTLCVICGNVKRVARPVTNHFENAGNAVPWLSNAVFEIDDGATNHWQVLYARDGHPVMIERRFGKGSIVLSSDSFFLSNEALAEIRDTTLLSHLIGDSRTVVFDETVHGLSDNRNVAWLLHRYHLHLLVAAIAFLLLLTLWQQTCPLLPRQHEPPDAVQRVTGKEDGIIRLLQRHVPAGELPRKMIDVWAQTEPSPDASARQAMLDELDRAKAAHTSPLETCRRLWEKGYGVRRLAAAFNQGGLPPRASRHLPKPLDHKTRKGDQP